MSGICDTCKRDECYMQNDGNDSCTLYIKGKPSNYKKLFGTPERAAKTIHNINCDAFGCEVCSLYQVCRGEYNFYNILARLNEKEE